AELYAWRMHVGNGTVQGKAMNALTATFGDDGTNCRADVDDNFSIDMPAAAQPASTFTIVKHVPKASMLIKGDKMTVNAPDAAALDKVVAELQAAAPAMTVKPEAPLDAQAEIDNSLTASQAAMDNLGQNPDPQDVARALSLQVVNFEVD